MNDITLRDQLVADETEDVATDAACDEARMADILATLRTALPDGWEQPEDGVRLLAKQLTEAQAKLDMLKATPLLASAINKLAQERKDHAQCERNLYDVRQQLAEVQAERDDYRERWREAARAEGFAQGERDLAQARVAELEQERADYATS